jgi:N-acetylneuraminic acid mutarotase
MAHAPHTTFYFTNSGLVLALSEIHREKMGQLASTQPKTSGMLTGQSQSLSVVQIEFAGANTLAPISGGESLPGRTNYIKGKDRSQWHTNLPTYGGITYAGLYNGIDLSYEGSGGQLKGTYHLSPGADPSLIRWRYGGTESISIDDGGNLHISLASSPDANTSGITERAPTAWQETSGKRIPVSVRYIINADKTVGFMLGDYDRGQPLTIDPTIVYSTYLGGFFGESAGSIWLDSNANIYVGGTTSSSDFPMSGNPFQPVYGGGEYDMFASKLSPDGSALIYSTFVGGGDWDVGGLAGVDAAGVATLGGWTSSDDFPTTPGAYQTEFAGTEDVAVARLTADGSDLIFGSYWGDEAVDEPYGFTLDGAGNTYFTGYYLPGFSFWAFVAALTPDGSQELFRRNLGGSVPGPGDENANTSGEGIVVDGHGNIFVTGYTRAADFPTTAGAYRTSMEAFEDGFITKLSPLGQAILYSTYIPGGVSDYPYDIAIDQDDNAYITGNTSSSDYPTTSGAFQSSCGDPRCSFLTKLNPSGSDLVYSSFLGGPDFHFETEDYGVVVRVNQQGNAYVAGYTSAPDFPVVNPLQATLHGPNDGFLTKFNPSGSGVEYSTYLGGGGGDYIAGLALDGLGNVYIAGTSSSSDFPLVNPYQPTLHGASDAVVAVIAEASVVTQTATPIRTGTPVTATPTPNPCGGVTSWRTETPMLTAHSNSAAAVLNDQLYVIGGASNSPTPVRNTQKFDPLSNTWSSRAAYPDGLGLAFQQAATVDGKIYTIGDTYQPAESFLEMYDPSSDSWRRKATLPQPLLNGAVAAYAGKVYIIGGQVANQLPSPQVYEYDPGADTLTTKAPMPTGQAEIGAAVIGNRIYVAGGYQYVHYVYDPAANSWNTVATPLTPSFSSPAVFAFNGELWIIGGYDNWTRRGYPPGQEVQIYNPANNSWHYGPALNRPRYYSTAAGVINGRAYLVGGIDLNSNSYPYDYLNSMESIAYLPCGTTTPTVTVIATNGTGTTTPLPTGTAMASVSPPVASHTVPSSSTATPTHGGQPSITPTHCPVQFTDVPEGSTFYSFVRCLACRQLINGYTSGCESGNPCFRPNNLVTRGQLSKIVSNSAGFSDPQTEQSFEDVPVGSTFFDFVGRLASPGYIGGYPCGGPGEPCVPPGNLPYFRPNNNATRGQISKVVSNAAGFSEPHTGHSFEDVPPGSTFYDFVERLYSRGVMSGYPCGGVGEPCLPPTNRPYFRPNANATRGQTSKIVSNTFFPNCRAPARK